MMSRYAWIVLLVALGALSYVAGVLRDECNKTQAELEKVRAEVQEVLKENEELAHHAEKLVDLLSDCADDLWQAYQRWDEYKYHAAVTEFTCKCLAPLPYSIGQEMECIAITLETERRFEILEQQDEEKARTEVW